MLHRYKKFTTIIFRDEETYLRVKEARFYIKGEAVDLVQIVKQGEAEQCVIKFIL